MEGTVKITSFQHPRLLWTHSCRFTSSLCWVPRTGCAIQGGVSAEQRDRIPSLDVLPTLHLMQPRSGVLLGAMSPELSQGTELAGTVCLSPMSSHLSLQGRDRGRERPRERGSFFWDREDELLVLPQVTFLA